MILREKIGSLLDGNVDVIVHQVNCCGAMNSGVAAAIRKKYPSVYTKYKDYCHGHKYGSLPGKCLFVTVDDGKLVANLFGQEQYGYDNRRYTNYEAVYQALELVKRHLKNSGKKTIGFPYKMASDRGGADWDVILAMIKSVFKDTEHEVIIYKLQS